MANTLCAASYNSSLGICAGQQLWSSCIAVASISIRSYGTHKDRATLHGVSGKIWQ